MIGHGYKYRLKTALFGYYFFGFHPLFYLRSEGLEHKGKVILWGAIERIELYDYCRGTGEGVVNETEMKIYFAGGRIRVPANVVQKGDLVKFWGDDPMDYKSEAYEFLKDHICRKVSSSIVFEKESLSERKIPFWKGSIIIVSVILFFVVLGFWVIR